MAYYKVVGVGQRDKYFDENSYQSVLNYIFNPDKAVYAGACNITSPELAAQEMEQVAINFNKNSGKHLRHSVLSFNQDEDISPEMAAEFAPRLCQHYAPEYQIVYAVHSNTDRVHIHFVMNQISCLDGHRYRGQKKDYYDFQKYMKIVTHLPIHLVKSREFSD